MKTNRLGASSLMVSEVGFGCMSLPVEDEARSMALMQTALDAGVTFFDTADLYGQGGNETFVGKALRSVRDRVVIATKVGNRWTPGQPGWTWDASKAYILQAVEHSLRRLGTDYIDLYQLHGGTLEDPIDDVIETFERLVEKGWIRAYGISSIRPSVIREYVQRSNIASVMMQYSILDRRPEESVLPLLHGAGISVIARGPVAGGRLANRPSSSDEPYLGYTPDQVKDIQEHLDGIRGHRSRSQVALRYALSHPAIATAIPGASRLEQLQENLMAAHEAPMTETERTAVQSWMPANRYELHR